MNIKDYIYIKIKIYITFNKQDFTIYQNIKINYILISYIFLTNFFNINIIKISKSIKIINYLNLVIKF